MVELGQDIGVQTGHQGLSYQEPECLVIPGIRCLKVGCQLVLCVEGSSRDWMDTERIYRLTGIGMDDAGPQIE